MSSKECSKCGSELTVFLGRTAERKNLAWCSNCDAVFRENVLLVEEKPPSKRGGGVKK